MLLLCVNLYDVIFYQLFSVLLLLPAALWALVPIGFSRALFRLLREAGKLK